MASPSPSFREAVAVQTEWGHFSQRRRVFFCLYDAAEDTLCLCFVNSSGGEGGGGVIRKRSAPTTHCEDLRRRAAPSHDRTLISPPNFWG